MATPMAFEIIADMAELADALDSGSSSRKGVEVRLLLSALFAMTGDDFVPALAALSQQNVGRSPEWVPWYLFA